MKTIAQHFEGFARAMGLERAGEAQRRDMELAFYGGATVMFKAMDDVATECGDDDALGARNIAALEQECAEFVVKRLQERMS
ncbi:MAG: hypothetical protein ACTHK2_04625 [Dokdonella sp.]|uniref:hypothetical protein n=1 Tax=Dokdonella sp. TaxID=2291710 RepID=UPI003F81EF84